ncbi:hypothetical protein [Allobaculum mucilyticum]|uniref:hypothetical protein n=1 Tax=Allobaculum mucilyticum TaxID=2834459 RepID=UPI001F6070C4|nr:hypothetical protein [Allobaculum mucilyticum]
MFPFAQQGRKISSAPEAHRSGQKHKQKADFGFIIKTIQQWLFKKARISLSTLEDLLLARISPIREGRADTRKKK